LTGGNFWAETGTTDNGKDEGSDDGDVSAIEEILHATLRKEGFATKGTSSGDNSRLWDEKGDFAAHTSVYSEVQAGPRPTPDVQERRKKRACGTRSFSVSFCASL
jgi:hypothetical protein